MKHPTMSKRQQQSLEYLCRHALWQARRWIYKLNLPRHALEALVADFRAALLEDAG